MGTGYFGSGVSDLLSRLEEEKKEKEEEQKPIGYIGVKYNPANVEEQSPTITTPEIPEEKSEPLTSKASREFDFDDPSERAAYYQEKIAWLEGIADEKGGQLAESSYEAYRYAIRKYNENVKLINEEVQPTEIKKPRQFEQKGVASRQRGIGELPSSNLQSEDMPKAIQKMDDYITAGIKGVGAGTAGFAESFSQLLVEAGERELALQEGYKPSDRWDVEEKDFIKKLLEAKYGGDRFKKIKGEAATWVSDKGAELVQEAQEWSKQFQLAQDAGEVEKFIYDMTAGGTSLAGALGIAWVTKDPNMAAAIFGLVARGGTYGKAREAGVDPLEAGAYGSQNQFTETILEAVGLELLLTKLPVGKGLSILLKGVGEGSQEWSQGFMGNLIEKYGWNKAKDVTEGLGREALIGFLLGSGTSLVIENLSKKYDINEKDITSAVEETYQYLHNITKDTSFQDVIDYEMKTDVTSSDDYLDDYLDKQSTQSILDDIDGREFEDIPPQYQPEIPDTVHGTGIEGTFAGKVSAKSPTWSKDIAKAINSGGISYDPIKGDVSGDGYAVSISEKYEHKFTSKDDITKEDVEKFADENKGMLNIEENFIGGWKPEGGNPEINVSTKKATLTEAVLLGKKNNQDAINDLSTFKDIYLRNVKAKEGDEAHANDVVHLFHVSEETRTDIDPEYMSTGQIGREKGQFENVETKALHEGYETKSNWYLEEGKIEARFGGGVLHELYVLKKDLYNKDEKGQKSDTDIKKEGYKGYISQDQARLFTKEIPVVVGKLSINKNESVKVKDAYKYSSPAPEPIFRRDSGIDLSKEPTDTQRREQQKLLDEGKISKQQYNERLGIEEDGQLFKDTGAQESATMSGDDVGDSNTPDIMDDWMTSQGKVSEVLRGTKGMTADDVMKKYPDIKLKRDVTIKDIHGKKSVIAEGEALSPYELKGGKVLLQDGDTYIVSKNTAQNLMGQAQKSEAKEFAPELDNDETIEEIQIVDGDYKWYTLSGEDSKNYRTILVEARPDETGLNDFESDMLWEKWAAGSYTSNHYMEEMNPLFHLRVTDKKTTDNKKITFLEEMQSDFATDVAKDKRRAEAEKRAPVSDNWIEKDNPIMKNWREEAVKRSLIEAVRTDSEYLSWTTGEQQNKRYPGLLAYGITEIKHSSKYEDKVVRIYEGKKVIDRLYVGKDGKVNEVMNRSIWEGKYLEDIIGKKYSAQIMENKNTYKDYIIKTDNEPMGIATAPGLYDKDLPHLIEKITGEKVTEIEVNNDNEIDTSFVIQGKNVSPPTEGDVIKDLETNENLIVISVDDIKMKVEVMSQSESEEIGRQFDAGEISAEQMMDKHTNAPVKEYNWEDTSIKDDVDMQENLKQPAIKITDKIRNMVKGNKEIFDTSGQLFKDTGVQKSATMTGDEVGDSSTPEIMDDWVTEIPYTDLEVIEDTEYSPTEETKEVRKDYEPIHVPNKTAVLGEDLQFREPTITKWYTPKLELMRNIGVEEILGELPEARQLLDIKATEINHQINEMIVKLKEGSSKKDRFNAWLRNKPIKQVADMRDLLNAYETAPQFLTPKQKETFNLVRDFTKNMLEITNKFREEAGLSKINNLKAYIPHFLDEVAAAAADGKYPYVADVYRWTGKKYKIPNNPTAKGRTVSKITDDLNEVFSKDLGKLLKAMAKYDLRDIYLAIPYAQVRAEIKALKGQIPKATLTELEEYIKYDILDALTPTDESINRFLLPSTNVMNAVLKPFGRVITDPVRLLSGAYRQGLMGGAIAGKPKLVIRNLFQKLLTMDLVPASDYIKAQFSAPTEVMEQIRETTFYKSSVATFEDLPPLMKVVEKGMMPFQKSHAGLKFISNVDVAMRAGYNYGQRMIEWSNSDKGQKYIRDYAKKHDIKKGTKEYNNLFWKEGDQIKEAVEIGSRSQWFYHSTDMPRVFRGQGARAIYSLQSWWMNYFGKHVGEMQKRTFQGKTGRGRVIPKAHRTLSIRGMAIIFGLMSALKRYTGIDMIKYTIFPFPNIKSISHGGKLLVDTYEIFVGNMEEKKTALKNVSKALALLIPFSGAYKQYKEWIIGDISTKQLLFYMEYDNNWKQIWVKTSPKKGVQSKPIGKIGGKSVKIGGTSKGKIGSITKKRIGE